MFGGMFAVLRYATIEEAWQRSTPPSVARIRRIRMTHSTPGFWTLRPKRLWTPSTIVSRDRGQFYQTMSPVTAPVREIGTTGRMWKRVCTTRVMLYAISVSCSC
jgi:hypothetical protein